VGRRRLRRVYREEETTLGLVVNQVQPLGSRGVLYGRSLAPASTLELPAQPPALGGDEAVHGQ
jgi:hypothetical protein